MARRSWRWAKGHFGSREGAPRAAKLSQDCLRTIQALTGLHGVRMHLAPELATIQAGLPVDCRAGN